MQGTGFIFVKKSSSKRMLVWYHFLIKRALVLFRCLILKRSSLKLMLVWYHFLIKFKSLFDHFFGLCWPVILGAGHRVHFCKKKIIYETYVSLISLFDQTCVSFISLFDHEAIFFETYVSFISHVDQLCITFWSLFWSMLTGHFSCRAPGSFLLKNHLRNVC